MCFMGIHLTSILLWVTEVEVAVVEEAAAVEAVVVVAEAEEGE